MLTSSQCLSIMTPRGSLPTADTNTGFKPRRARHSIKRNRKLVEPTLLNEALLANTEFTFRKLKKSHWPKPSHLKWNLMYRYLWVPNEIHIMKRLQRDRTWCYHTKQLSMIKTFTMISFSVASRSLLLRKLTFVKSVIDVHAVCIFVKSIIDVHAGCIFVS